MLRSYLDREQAASDDGSLRLLAIDTSADRAGVAVLVDGGLHETTWPAARSQTTQVLPRIEYLLDGVDMTTADLSGVAVAIGPGTFTGLRVGLSLAKGIAMAHGLPILGIPTLAATALPWLEAGLPVMAVLPAGRGRLVWQPFHPDVPERDGGESPVNGTPEEFLAVLGKTDVRAVVGELPTSLGWALASAPVPVVASAGLTSRVGAVALLAQHRLRQGDSDDLTTLEPIYVHGTPKATQPVRDGPR